MTDLELKKLKDDLWHAADVLRSGAHLAANKYGQPILGLIFLRYADILFKQHKREIETEYAKLKGSRREKLRIEISIEKCGFYLPEEAYYDYINDAPDDANKAKLVKAAMEAIAMTIPAMAASAINQDGYYKGIKLCGRVKVVDSFPDLKVKVVDFPG